MLPPKRVCESLCVHVVFLLLLLLRLIYFGYFLSLTIFVSEVKVLYNSISVHTFFSFFLVHDQCYSSGSSASFDTYLTQKVGTNNK